MGINFTARHTHITSGIEEYCEKRVQSLEKVLGQREDQESTFECSGRD